MKKMLPILACLLIAVSGFSQKNMELVSNYQRPNSSANDIWGYVAPDSTEYALVGWTVGFSVVSLADPENPVEIIHIPGDTTAWRDIKTWKHFAYVISDGQNDDEGILIADLRFLPDSVPWRYVNPDINGEILKKSHNIYIDEYGVAYVPGSNVLNGTPLYFDVDSDPGTMIYLGASQALNTNGNPVYSHDCYARENLLYSGDIYEGSFSITDVTDKANPVLLNTQLTPYTFTHNVWPSDDGNVLYTTDERNNAPVASYDISDPHDIKLLDEFRPLLTIGSGVIPHNVHVWDDFLIISYYTDGCILVDAAKPDNLIEVGNFDTWLGADGLFSGVWGAYPFLPSGLVLVTDRSGGLYVFEPTYVRACYLEGTATEAGTGTTLNGVKIEILNTLVNEQTDLIGEYKTGIVDSGMYYVAASKTAYLSDTVAVNLDNGVLTILDFELEQDVAFSGTVNVMDINTGLPIEGAKINISNSEIDFVLTTNNDGKAALFPLYTGIYNLIVGSWGYLSQTQTVFLSYSGNQAFIMLEPGIKDGFALDLGWTESGSATVGNWERVDPTGFQNPYTGDFVTPPADVDDDIGNRCYVTGDGTDNYGFPISPDADTRLTSPHFDLTGYTNPYLSFEHSSISVNLSQYQGDDSLRTYIHNGQEEILVDTRIFEFTPYSLPEWSFVELNIKDHITLTDSMQIIFEFSDFNNEISHSSIDIVQVYDSISTSVGHIPTLEGQLSISPNPSDEVFNLAYDLEEKSSESVLVITDITGRSIQTHALNNNSGTIQLRNLPHAGMYFAHITANGKISETIKFIKL